MAVVPKSRIIISWRSVFPPDAGITVLPMRSAPPCSPRPPVKSP